MVTSPPAPAPQRQDLGPLADLRVLEVGTLIAAPFACRLLADLGAEVVKIEHPSQGDPLRAWGGGWDGTDSLWYLVQSRGKQSVAADLHDPADQALVRALALESDVLVENFRPGRLEGWNLDPADLLRANPRLIVVRISGYGQTGPLRDQPGFGTVAEAAGGLRYLTGEPDRPPARVGLSLGDSVASLYAVVGLLTALHERHRSGRGQVVDVALTEAVFSLLEGVLPEYGLTGAIRERVGNIAHNSAPTNAYACADGTLVCIAANTTPLFRALFHEMDRDDVADDRRLWANAERVRRAAELDGIIGDWAGVRSSDEVIERLRSVRVPVSRINSIADIAADPQFQARAMIVPVDDPRLPQPLLVPGVVPKLSRTPGSVRPLGRPLGADTEAIRSRFAPHAGATPAGEIELHREVAAPLDRPRG
jgi:formyl-CoA transferase